MAEWLRRGLQILARRFDSGSGLHTPANSRQAMSRRTAVALAAAALVAAPVSAADPLSPTQAAAMLEGAWSNAAQFAQAPEFLKRPPAAGFPYPWLDRQHATFRVVSAPQLTGADGRAVYLEWRRGGPDGPVSRQRLWVFVPGPDRPEMAFFSFRAPADFEGAKGTAERFAALEPTALVGYGPTCNLAVERGPSGWNASIAENCRIVAQSGRSMRLAARISLNGDTLFYEEEGVLPDGSYAFRVPGGIAYEFARLE